MKRTTLVTLGIALAFALAANISVAESGTKPSVRIEQIMMIKECLSNKTAGECLSGKDIHIIQRILTHYVIAQASRQQGG